MESEDDVYNLLTVWIASLSAGAAWEWESMQGGGMIFTGFAGYLVLVL